MKKISGLLALLLLSAVISPVGASSSTSIAITAQSGLVQQGRPFKFLATATNGTEFPFRADVTFYLAPKGSDDEISAARWVQTIPANGGTGSYNGRIVTSQWFKGLGQFRIRALSPTNEVLATLDFEVGPSEVSVPRFEDVTDEMGLSTTIGDFACGDWGQGAAWGDFDGDGLVDLVLPRREAAPKLWMNTGNGFSDEAAARGISTPGVIALGAVVADYDNDGDLDIYVTTLGKNLLFQNDGSGHFTEVGEAAGVAGASEPSQSASWGDFNGDGHLDLAVSNHFKCEEPGRNYYENHLYENNGDGTFTDVTEYLHAAASTKGASFQMIFFDYDNDGDEDIYLVNDFLGPQPQANVLWRNDGPGPNGTWKFTDVSVSSGMKLTLNSMGIALGDYDRDGKFDIGISNVRAPYLMRGNPNGTFSNVASSAGVDRILNTTAGHAITWGLSFADLNNDGWEDLYLAAGRLGIKLWQPNQVYTNAQDGTFLDHSAPSGADDDGVGRGIAFADFDQDGRVDIFVVNQDGKPKLFRNVTDTGGASWLQVDLAGKNRDKSACGTVVFVTTPSGTQMKKLSCGGTSLASSHEPILHFGLGTAPVATEVKVRWPSGKTESHQGVAAGQRVTLAEGEGGGDPEPEPEPIKIPNPRRWKPWFLKSAKAFRLAKPPGNKSKKTVREIKELLRIQRSRTPAERSRARELNQGPAGNVWTQMTLDMIVDHHPRPPVAGRALAMVHTGLHDALIAARDTKAAYSRKRPYQLNKKLKPLYKQGGSSYPPDEAVMAGAAEVILPALFPNENPKTFTDLAKEIVECRLIAGVNYRSDIARGRKLGRRIGRLVLERAAIDNHTSTTISNPKPDPADDSIWSPTPPGLEQNIGGPVGTWLPWVMPSQSAARIDSDLPPPYAYGSPQFMDEVREVMDVQENLTSHQKSIAIFWDDGPATYTPAGHWNEIALELIDSYRFNTAQTALMLATLNAAEADSAIAFFEAKYEWWNVRPITAIHRLCEGGRLCSQAEIDADPNLADEPKWFPHIGTPPFPAYPSGHSTFSGAAAEVLGAFIPEARGLLTEQAEEAAMSRLYGGIHYRSDNDAGLQLGRQVATYALDRIR